MKDSQNKAAIATPELKSPRHAATTVNQASRRQVRVDCYQRLPREPGAAASPGRSLPKALSANA